MRMKTNKKKLFLSFLISVLLVVIFIVIEENVVRYLLRGTCEPGAMLCGGGFIIVGFYFLAPVLVLLITPFIYLLIDRNY